MKKKTAPYRYPRITQFVEELPKTMSGKIRQVENRDRDKNKPYPAINLLECKGCERCVIACPARALKLTNKLNERGYRYVEYPGAGCTGCGACYYTCPEPNAVEVHIPLKEKKEER